jgi:hypothetical protein
MAFQTPTILLHHHLMPSARYELLPSSDDLHRTSTEGELEDGRHRYPVIIDPRFNQPTPSPYARAALLIFVFFLFWLAFSLRKMIWLGGIEIIE